MRYFFGRVIFLHSNGAWLAKKEDKAAKIQDRKRVKAKQGAESQSVAVAEINALVYTHPY